MPLGNVRELDSIDEKAKLRVYVEFRFGEVEGHDARDLTIILYECLGGVEIVSVLLLTVQIDLSLM